MKYLFYFMLLLAAVSCEILEEDISGRAVTAIAPADDAEVPAGSVMFRWRAVDRATGYELCVATEGRIAADTLLAADTLGLARSYGCRLTLEAGDYEWHVEAFNSAYGTRSETLHLTVAAESAPEVPEEDGSSTPPHAADCNSPKLVQSLCRRRTALPAEMSAPKHGPRSDSSDNSPQP